MKQKSFIVILVILLTSLISTLDSFAQQNTSYLNNFKEELKLTWPKNRTMNIVFHGHSVPTGYYITPDVLKYGAYPHLSVEKIKANYPFAVLNSITTTIGGEHAERGEKRFVNEVLTMRPDILFIDYALNDRNIVKGNPQQSLERAKIAWQKMIDAAKAYTFTTLNGKEHHVKIILMTPTPDTRENILSDTTALAKHSEQIRQLAKDNNVELVDSYALFKEIASKESLKTYMAQSNHINEKGHKAVGDEIAKLFITQNEVADGLYYIKGVFTEKFMTVKKNSEIVVKDSLDSNNQKFWINNTPNGYSITTFNKKMVLGMMNGSLDNGAKLAQTVIKGIEDERFKIYPVGEEGKYWIYNKDASKYIATPGRKNKNGTPIIQYGFRKSLNYQWKIIPVKK